MTADIFGPHGAGERQSKQGHPSWLRISMIVAPKPFAFWITNRDTVCPSVHTPWGNERTDGNKR